MKRVIFRLEFTLSFEENVPKLTWKSFNTKFPIQENTQKCNDQLRQSSAISSNWVFLVLGYNSVNSLRVTKIFKEIIFEGVCGNLEPKTRFQRQSVTKYLRLTLVFAWNSALRDKLNFFFYSFFDRIAKIFILAGRLHTRVSSYEV